MNVQPVSTESTASASRVGRPRTRKAVNVPNRMLRPREVTEAIGLSRSTLYRLVQRGDFDPPVRLTDTAIGWPESVVRAWIRKRSTAESSGSGE
jgi:prophage regulatory protein